MPYKNKEEYNAYMREYRRKNKGLQSKPSKNKPVIPSAKISFKPSIRFYGAIAEVLGIRNYSRMNLKTLKMNIAKELLK